MNPALYSYSLLYPLTAGIGLLLAGEYYVLITFLGTSIGYGENKWILLLLKVTLKTGVFLRISFVGLILVGLFLVPQSKNNLKREPRSFFFGALQVVLFIISGYGLLSLQKHSLPFITFAYPAFLGLFIASSWLVSRWFNLSTTIKFGLQPEKQKLTTDYGFNFRTSDGWINVPNPYRGVFVSGGAGSGKSYSLAVPMIHQAVKKGYCGLVYDFKFPTLAEELNRALVLNQPPKIKHYIINCFDLSRSHRINPLHPVNMPVAAFAEEYAQAILQNLWPESIRKQDFWMRSATALLTATIWFLKKHHPDQCTLPHAVSLILYRDYVHTLSMLETDEECADLIRSALTAVENQAEGQVAGVIGTLQMLLTRIASPEIAWVLSGNDFSLDLNNPQSPVLLTLGSHPSLTESFSPVLSLIATVALKQMNQPGKQHSIVLLDEAPTLYIPKLEMIPATARSNKVVTVYMAQDLSQMVAHYGREIAEVIISNLNNQFYGRAASAITAKHVSELFGKEDKEQQSQSFGRSSNGHWPGHSRTVSRSLQEKQVVRPQDVLNLRVGEFMGLTVESKQPAFWSHIQSPKIPQGNFAIPAFASGVDAQENFKLIRKQIDEIILQYPKKQYAQSAPKYKR